MNELEKLHAEYGQLTIQKEYFDQKLTACKQKIFEKIQAMQANQKDPDKSQAKPLAPVGDDLGV